MVAPPEPNSSGSRESSKPEGEHEGRSPVALVAVASIVLGVMVLVGGVGTIAIRALRAPPAGSASAAPPVVVAPPPKPAPPAPLAPPVLPPPPESPPALAKPRSNAPGGVAATLAAARDSEADAAIPVTARRPIAGDAGAAVTVSVFGDLTCPHTLSALDRLQAFRERHASALRFVFYERPLGSDPVAARRARRLALATLRDGPRAGWTLLERAEVALGDEKTAPQIESELERREIDELLEQDRVVGSVLDVRVTPTLFVNGARLEGEPPDELLESLIQREQRAVRWLTAQGLPSDRAYALRVRRNLLEVEDGAPDRACVPNAGSPVLGPRDALVTLVEFSGFECEACRAADESIRAVLRRHPREVRRVFKGLAPRGAQRAHRVAAFALSAQGALGDAAFWSLHAALRAAPSGLDDAGLLAIAKGVGLDGKRLLRLADDELNERRLTRELELAEALDVRQNPTLFVNGRLLEGGLEPAELERVIVEELAVARRIARAGVPPARFEDLSCRATTAR